MLPLPVIPLTLTLQAMLRLGPLRFTPYGVCAALGLIAAMLLAGATGKRTGVGAEVSWDIGLFALLLCLTASRLLLVLGDPAAFARYPLLVLRLPSLTWAGMVLAGMVLLVYVRRKGLSLRCLLDTFAPAAALLAAFLELGHWLEGSEPGMPPELHWTGPAAASYPVALYGMLFAVALCLILLALLRQRAIPGKVAACGLLLGSVGCFSLDMISQPVPGFEHWPLEPGECIALCGMLMGAALGVAGLRRVPASPEFVYQQAAPEPRMENT